MTTVQFTPRDEDARQTILDSLDETLFVDASAGTGKTTSLVNRVVNLVASARTTLDRIAAITFTEAAAAELRDRIRQELEKAAEATSRGIEERERCRQGVGDLDQASIQTLHSFASALLHERPLEAGLPPGFETTDEIAASLKFDDAWEEWLDKALDKKSEVGSHLAIVLSLGLKLPQLKDIAIAFHKNYNDLVDVDFPNTTEGNKGVAELLVDGLENLADLCEDPDAGDKLYEYILDKLEEAPKVASLTQDPVLLGHRIGQVLPFRPGNSGAARNWPDHTSPKEVRDSLKDIEIGLRRRALLPVLGALRQFVLEYADQRRNEGRAEFHDLLVWSSELLRDNLEVRDHFRHKFTHLLIDESQDTDPLQAGIVVLLAEEELPGSNMSLRPDDWRDVSPKMGKLFVVGDPKQSIYRFRRADVSQLERLRERMGGRTVRLTQNFRSQRPVTDWVNHLFSQWMGSGEIGIQASYEEMSHRWESASLHSARPRVWALADEVSEVPMGAVRAQETEEIALLLRQAIAEPWQVLDREATEAEGSERYRGATFADICILMPTRTGLRQLELALENAEVPYRLENASLVFETQEIRDLMNCLRAIDDPADEVATVAALRSPAFGCSDVELLLHRQEGGSFNYIATRHGLDEGPVSAAMEALRHFHRERVWHPVGLLIDRFVRERQLMEAALGSPRTREQWRRYRFVIEQGRRFSEASEPARNSLRAFLEWMENQADENARITETPVPEDDEDAVRIMTVHAAKGLEFPVVILTGINSLGTNRRNAVLFDRSGGRVEVGTGSQNGRFETEGYAAQREREQNQDYAERVRLMYVAATRARDHLVISLRRQPKPQSGKGTLAHEISEFLEGAPVLWDSPELGAPDVPMRERGVDQASDVDHSLEAREQWANARETLLKKSGRPSFIAATALGHKGEEEKQETDADEPWRRGRAGTNVGRALHAVMQSTNLDTGEDVDVWARAFAVTEGIADREAEVARLARRALESQVVRRAVASGSYWREVPVAVPIGEGSLQGFIDLMFEEDEELVVVDYKTDSVQEDSDTNISTYRMQGAAYALALEKATGKPVKEVVFLFPNRQPAVEIKLADLATLIAQAEALAVETLSKEKE